MKKLLVISHEASRSGAPILLLNFLKSYRKRNQDFEVDIIISRNGPLYRDFKKISNRILVLDDGFKFKSIILDKVLRVIKLFFTKNACKKVRLKKFVSSEYDLIFSNTITNGAILHDLQLVRGKVISYIHELENTIQNCTNPETLAYTFKYTDTFIVPSLAVKFNLLSKHKVSASQIQFLNYFIPDLLFTQTHNQLKSKLGLGKELIIGCVGTLEWRKGADLFIHLIMLFKSELIATKVKFIWVGVDKISKIYKEIIHDIELAGLGDDIILIDKVDNPLDYLALIDIPLMLSREDPYPLVVLEAAMLKKPIICFDKSGGASEFLSNENGIIVPYLDLRAVVKNIIKLLKDEDLRNYYGERARAAYLLKHSEENAMKEFEAFIEEFSQSKKGTDFY